MSNNNILGDEVQSDNNGIVRAIEPLRAFAAFSVLMLHVIYFTNWMDFPKTGPLAWFWVGWLGVDLFFVISGFVVTMAAFRELGRAQKKPRIFFLARRIARIAPLYYLSMIVFLLAINHDALKGDQAWLQVLSHLFFVHNFSQVTAGAINGPTWTIGTEMQLYLLVAALIPFLSKFRPLIFVCTCVMVAIGFRYFAYTLNVGAASSLLSHVTTQMPGMLDSFGMGMALAMLRQRGKLTSLSVRYWLILCLIAACGLIACQQILSIYRESYWDNWILPTFFRSAAAFACASLVLAALTAPQKMEAAIPRLFIYLGQISYGIYLWHAIVILFLLKYGALGKFAFLLITLATTITLATISWVFIEKPITRAVLRWRLLRSVTR